MLESMGKANKTPDNEFDVIVLDFQKQQVSCFIFHCEAEMFSLKLYCYIMLSFYCVIVTNKLDIPNFFIYLMEDIYVVKV